MLATPVNLHTYNTCEEASNMPDNKKVAWLVLVGSVLLIMWLRRSGDDFSELHTWLKSKDLTEFEDPLQHAGQSISTCYYYNNYIYCI